MRFNLEIKIGNAAMQTKLHIADALQQLAAEFEDAPDRTDEIDAAQIDDGRVYDENGNRVGSWNISNSERVRWADIDTMPPSMIGTPIDTVTTRAAIRDYAFHRDGEPCIRAMTVEDCPENHRYGRTFESAH